MAIFLPLVCVGIALYSAKVEPIKYKYPEAIPFSTVTELEIDNIIGGLTGPRGLAFRTERKGGNRPVLDEVDDWAETFDDDEDAEAQAAAAQATADEAAKKAAFDDDEKEVAMYAGLFDGSVVRVSLLTGNISKVFHTGNDPSALRSGFTCGGFYTEMYCGRPTDLTFDNDQIRLVVVDAYKGILMGDVENKLFIKLASEAEADDYGYVSHIAVSKATGFIYFIETSTQHKLRDSQAVFLHAGPLGRLVSYDPNEGLLNVLATKLHFPSGIHVVTDGDEDDSILISENTRARVRRVFLPSKSSGRKKLKVATWLDKLPCRPHGITKGYGTQEVLVACAQRSTTTDTLAKYPQLRAMLAPLPDWVMKFVYSGDTYVLRARAEAKIKKGKLQEVLKIVGSTPYTDLTLRDDEAKLYLGSSDNAVTGVGVAKLPRFVLD